ncbi:MAG: YhgE/Pip family protein [Acidimicrobiales bacterium]
MTPAAVRLGLVEVKRFTRGRMRRTALVVMLLIPLLYGGLYLWAFWNPYGNLDHVPVALVNLDRPVHSPGGTIAAGSLLTAKLLRGHALNWRRTSATKAKQGVADGRYYAALTIPLGFSASVSSLASSDPRPAELTAELNAASNYIASQLMGSVFSAVKEAAATSFSTEFLDHIFLAVANSNGSTGKAASGARQIAAGASRAAAGANQLAPGLSAAAGGASHLDGALGALSSGAGRLATGLASLNSGLANLAERAGALPHSSAKLSSGAAQVAAGTLQSSSGISRASSASAQLASGASQLHTLLELYQATDPLAAVSPVYQQILQAAETLASGMAQLSAGLAQAKPGAHKLAAAAAALAQGSSELASLAPQLANAIDQAASGASQLAPGASKLGDGAAQAQSGADKLGGGLATLAAGSSSLQSGLDQLSGGSSALASGLSAAAGQTAPFAASNVPARAALVANPVALSSRELHPVPDYGTAFAPYFIPLALWVGCLMLFFLLRPLSRRAMALGTRPWVVALGGLLPVAALAVVQAALVLVVVEVGLGLPAVHPLALWAFAFLSAVTFAAVIQMLEALLGSAGRVVALAMLILQLVSSAGTYPIQTSPGFIQWVQPLLPMTYMVNGMRDAVSGSLVYLNHDVIILLIWLAVASTITTWSARRGQVLNYKVLQPEIEMSVT